MTQYETAYKSARLSSPIDCVAQGQLIQVSASKWNAIAGTSVSSNDTISATAVNAMIDALSNYYDSNGNKLSTPNKVSKGDLITSTFFADLKTAIEKACIPYDKDVGCCETGGI